MLDLLKDKNKKKEECQIVIIYFVQCIRKLHYYGDVLYIHSIGNQLLNTMVVFKICDSVPSVRYSSVCDVLCLWRILVIPTYRVYIYTDYDIIFL